MKKQRYRKSPKYWEFRSEPCVVQLFPLPSKVIMTTYLVFLRIINMLLFRGSSVKKLSNRFTCTAAIFAGLFISAPALASENGSGHYLPGTAATIIDMAPTKPGWVVEPIYLHYQGDVNGADQVPVAGLDTLGMDAKLDVLLAGGFYTLPQPVLGARYSVGAYLPYIWMTVEAAVVGDYNAQKVRDTESGLGDITLIPIMLAWETGSWQFSGALSVYTPTGDYELGRLANPGLNYWSVDPFAGISYNNDKIGFNAGFNVGVMFNTENSDTDYRSGSMFHLDGSIQQMLPVGPGFASLGVEGFYLQQLNADSGQRDIFGDFKGRTVGAGPTLGYVLPIGENTLVTELRWLPELDTKNRLQGDSIWLKLVYQF